MSGKKETYVQLTATQRDQMLRQCREARDEAGKQRERAAQLERANKEVQSRIATLGNKISGQITDLSNEMHEIERKQSEAFRSALERQDADIRNEIQQQRKEINQMIGKIEQQINSKEQNHQRLAEFWSEQAEAYLKEIENYRHVMFTPNRLQALRTRLGQVQTSMDVQAYQAAISTAIEAFNDAVALRLDVVEAELEWTKYFERLSNDIAEVSADVNAAKILEFEIGGEKVQANIDYWTNGALIELAHRIAEIQEALHNSDEVTSNTLVSLIAEIDNMKHRLSTSGTGLIDSAKEALMLSAYRVDMANDVVSALESMGWKLDDYTYRNNEQKDAIHAKIVDRTGNECIVIVEPHNNQGRLENKLGLDFFNDNGFDTSSTETFVSSIRHELQTSGIKLDLRCVEGYENKPSDREEIRNIAQVRGQRMLDK